MPDEQSVAIVAHETLENNNAGDWSVGIARSAFTRALDKGVDLFLSPVTKGLCLRTTSMLADMDGARLSIYLPYSDYGQIGERWSKSDSETLNEILEKANKVTHCDEVLFKSGKRGVLDKGVHSWGKVTERLELMVEDSFALIAIYDGRQFGLTRLAFQYARKLGKRVYWINPIVKKAKWI